MKKIVFTLALALASTLVYAEPASTATAEPANEIEQAKNGNVRTGVRKPVGDVNKFWDAIAWNDMSPEEQQLWSLLEDGASWDKLSKKTRAAATALGFDRKSWNSVPAGQ